MVSPPDIDDGVELAPDKLVIVVGDIGSKVSRRAVAPYHYVIFILTEGGGDKPGGSFLLADITLVL